MTFSPTTILQVSLNFGDIEHPVGTLLLENRTIWFEYHAAFLETKLNISPFQVNFKPGAQASQKQPFEGLFGVFNDSLPDGWGRLLIDRRMHQLAIPHQKLTPLDRLALVGNRGMGALCYRPEILPDTTKPTIDLDLLAETSQTLLASNADTFFNDLLTLNGSSAGARPKIIAQVSNDMSTLYADTSVRKNNCEHWLIKFSNTTDSIEAATIEYAYSLMAKHAQIIMPDTHLFITQKGQYFACKRFDRQHDQRLHMHTLAGLIDADHRAPTLDYETALKVTMLLTKNHQDLCQHFRLAVFNVMAHNRDDHSKNFSYLMDQHGQWRFAPAYDLTFSYGPGGEQSMTVMGEGKNPNRGQLLALAKQFQIKNAATIIDEVSETIKQWPDFAETSGVTKRTSQIIGKSLQPF